MRRAVAGVLLGLAGLLSAAPALGADHQITAGPAPLDYSTKDVTIDQGDTITFTNSDNGSQAKHDVTAENKGADGKPLFRSELIDPGQSSPVAGVEYLTTGDYAFTCSLHNFMKGTIHVTANGTPKPRPEGTPAPDTTPPEGSVKILDSRIGAVTKRKALRVALKANEKARFRLVAKVGKTTIAKGTATVTDSKRTAAISLTSAGKKLLARAKSATVKLSAAINDAANNKSSATATRKLRR